MGGVSFIHFTFLYPAVADYDPGPFSITFGSPANDRKCINIPLVVDDIVEGSENFAVSLNLLSSTVRPGGNPSIMVTIIGEIGSAGC
jgi:hypothetical protein